MGRHRRYDGGFTTAVIACGVFGLLTALAVLTIGSRDGVDGDAVAPVASEEYGRRLIANTSELLGPDRPDPGKRYASSRLNCGSCHLGSGEAPGTLTLLQATER